MSLNKANEKYSQAKTNLNNKKDEDVEKNSSIELNFLGDEEIDAEDGLFNESGTNFSAHSETYLDKTNGSLSYEKSK